MFEKRDLRDGTLGEQRRPGGIGCEGRRRHALLVAAGDVHGEQRRPAAAAGVAEEHDDPTVRAESRAFIVKAFGQDALARAVRLHDADGEFAAADLGEGDVVALRRPYRRRVGAFAETDALRAAALRAHDVDLLRAATV